MHIVPMDLTLELNRWAAGGVVDGDLLFDSVYRRLQVIAKSCQMISGACHRNLLAWPEKMVVSRVLSDD